MFKTISYALLAIACVLALSLTTSVASTVDSAVSDDASLSDNGGVCELAPTAIEVPDLASNDAVAADNCGWAECIYGCGEAWGDCVAECTDASCRAACRAERVACMDGCGLPCL